ncbi:hypothetical protein AYI69_g17 [Smittium culicis]|uniref:RSE1/DDB1/CPSF1 C-terminal domain-containing protein n=1 Tax=Smittium culicis TaxID=133412 RepID=A0A1R1YU83_9FUNG|nr:hypothetical protein AYI69_g17 [Smittium culicis]
MNSNRDSGDQLSLNVDFSLESDNLSDNLKYYTQSESESDTEVPYSSWIENKNGLNNSFSVQSSSLDSPNLNKDSRNINTVRPIDNDSFSSHFDSFMKSKTSYNTSVNSDPDFTEFYGYMQKRIPKHFILNAFFTPPPFLLFYNRHQALAVCSWKNQLEIIFLDFEWRSKSYSNQNIILQSEYFDTGGTITDMSFLCSHGDSLSQLENSSISLLTSILHESKSRSNSGWSGVSGKSTLQLYEGISNFIIETQSLNAKSSQSPSETFNNSSQSPRALPESKFNIENTTYLLRLAGKLPLPSDIIPMKIVPLLLIRNSAIIFTPDQALFIQSTQVTCGDVNIYKVPFLGTVQPNIFDLIPKKSSIEIQENSTILSQRESSYKKLSKIESPKQLGVKRWWESSTRISKLELEHKQGLLANKTEIKDSQLDHRKDYISNSPNFSQLPKLNTYPNCSSTLVDVGTISGWNFSHPSILAQSTNLVPLKNGIENFYVVTDKGYILLAEVTSSPSITFHVVKLGKSSSSENLTPIHSKKSLDDIVDSLSGSSSNETSNSLISCSNVISVLDSTIGLTNSTNLLSSGSAENSALPSNTSDINNLDLEENSINIENSQPIYLKGTPFDQNSPILSELILVGGNGCDNNLLCVSSFRKNLTLPKEPPLTNSNSCLTDEFSITINSNSQLTNTNNNFGHFSEYSPGFSNKHNSRIDNRGYKMSPKSKDDRLWSQNALDKDLKRNTLIYNCWVHSTANVLFKAISLSSENSTHLTTSKTKSIQNESIVKLSEYSIGDQLSPLFDWDTVPLQQQKDENINSDTPKQTFKLDFTKVFSNQTMKKYSISSNQNSKICESFNPNLFGNDSFIICGATNRNHINNANNTDFADDNNVDAKSSKITRNRDNNSRFLGSKNLRKLQYGHPTKLVKRINYSFNATINNFSKPKSKKNKRSKKPHISTLMMESNKTPDFHITPKDVFVLSYPTSKIALKHTYDISDTLDSIMMSIEYMPDSKLKPNRNIIISSFAQFSTISFESQNSKYDILSDKKNSDLLNDFFTRNPSFFSLDRLMNSGEVIYAKEWNLECPNHKNVETSSVRTNPKCTCESEICKFSNFKCTWIIVFKNHWALISVYNSGLIISGSPSLVYLVETSWSLTNGFGYSHKELFTRSEPLNSTPFIGENSESNFNAETINSANISHSSFISLEPSSILSNGIGFEEQFTFSNDEGILSIAINCLQPYNAFNNISKNIHGTSNSRNSQAKEIIGFRTTNPSSDCNSIISCSFIIHFLLSPLKKNHNLYDLNNNSTAQSLDSNSRIFSFYGLNFSTNVLDTYSGKSPVSCLNTYIPINPHIFSHPVCSAGFINGDIHLSIIKNNFIQRYSHLDNNDNEPDLHTSKFKNTGLQALLEIKFNFPKHQDTCTTLAILNSDYPLQSCIKNSFPVPSSNISYSESSSETKYALNIPNDIRFVSYPMFMLMFIGLRNGGLLSFNIYKANNLDISNSIKHAGITIYPSESQTLKIGNTPVYLSTIPPYNSPQSDNNCSSFFIVSDTSYIAKIDDLGLLKINRLVVPELEFENSKNSYSCLKNCYLPRSPTLSNNQFSKNFLADNFKDYRKPKHIFKISNIPHSNDLKNGESDKLQVMAILNTGSLVKIEVSRSSTAVITSLSSNSFIPKQVLYDNVNSCFVSVGSDLSSDSYKSIIKLIDPTNGLTIDQVELLPNETVLSISFWEIDISNNTVDNQIISNSTEKDGCNLKNNYYRYLLVGTSLKASRLSSTGRLIVYRFKLNQPKNIHPAEDLCSKSPNTLSRNVLRGYNNTNNVNVRDDLKIKFVWKMSTGKPISAISPIGKTGFVAIGYGNNLSIYQLDIFKKVWNECASSRLRWPISNLCCFDPIIDHCNTNINLVHNSKANDMYKSKMLSEIDEKYNYWIISVSSLKEAHNLYSFRLPKYVNSKIFHNLKISASNSISGSVAKSLSNLNPSETNKNSTTQEEPSMPYTNSSPPGEEISDIGDIQFNLFSDATNGANNKNSDNSSFLCDDLMQDDNSEVNTNSSSSAIAGERFTKQVLEKGSLEHLFTAKQGYPVSHSIFLGSRLIFSIDRSGYLRLFAVPTLPESMNPWSKFLEDSTKSNKLIFEDQLLNIDSESSNHSKETVHVTDSTKSYIIAKDRYIYDDQNAHSNKIYLANRCNCIQKCKAQCKNYNSSSNLKTPVGIFSNYLSKIGLDSFVLNKKHNYNGKCNSSSSLDTIGNKQSLSCGNYEISYKNYALDSLSKFLTRDIPTGIKKNTFLNPRFYNSLNVIPFENSENIKLKPECDIIGISNSCNFNQKTNPDLNSLLVSTISGSFWSFTRIHKIPFLLLRTVQELLEADDNIMPLFSSFENRSKQNSSLVPMHNNIGTGYFSGVLNDPDNNKTSFASKTHILSGIILSLYLNKTNFYSSKTLGSLSCSNKSSDDLFVDSSNSNLTPENCRDDPLDSQSFNVNLGFKDGCARIKWIAKNYQTLYPFVYNLIVYWKSLALEYCNLVAINLLTLAFSMDHKYKTSPGNGTGSRSLCNKLETPKLNIEIPDYDVDPETKPHFSDTSNYSTNHLSPYVMDSIIEMVVRDIERVW